MADKSGPLAEIGSAIAQTRLERGLTRDQLRRAAGISLEYIGKIERNDRTPQPGKLVDIAEALGTTVAALMQRAQDVRLDQPISVYAADQGRSNDKSPAQLSVAINLPGSAEPGKSFFATMTICNHGPSVALDVKSELNVIPHDLIAEECDAGIVSFDGKIVLFREPRLEARQAKVYQIRVKVDGRTQCGGSRELTGRILSPTVVDDDSENDVDKRSLKIAVRP